MEYTNITLGQYLREQRELKGLSIDEAALETNIAKKYIEALEKDEYGFFPAEMYITGFLSAYIEMLELDKDLVLSMYRRLINKEKEAPLEAFYDLHKSDLNLKTYSKWIVIGIPIFSFIILLIILFFNNISNNKGVDSLNSTNYSQSGITNITLEQLKIDNKISINNRETIIIQDTDSNNLLEIKFLGQYKNQLKFRIGQNQYNYKIGDILNTEISNADITGFNIEIVSLNDPNVELMLSVVEKKVLTASFFDINPYLKAIRNTIKIATVKNIHTFNATISASRPVWIEYQADTTPIQQQILNAGDQVSFRFIDGVKVSLGNAGAAVISFSEFTNVVRGGVLGEASQSIFYRKKEGQDTVLYRSQLK